MNQLFHVDLERLLDEDGMKISIDRRRTLRQRALLERGEHPTGNGAVDLEHRCKECAHCVLNGYKGHRWYKCEASRLGRSSSAASDIRISWPGCPKFAPSD